MESLRFKPYGVVTDLSPIDTPDEAWNDSEGITFREARCERERGYVFRETAPLFAPEAMHYRKAAGGNQWYYAGPDGIGLNIGSAQYDLSPVGWGTVGSGLHTWCGLNDVPVYNHPEKVPHYHDGNSGNPMAPLPNWPSGWSCQVMRSFKFFLLALGVNDGAANNPNQMRWSASADVGNIPDQWLPAADNDAGDMFFADTPGDLVDAVPLKDGLIVYKRSSAFLVQYLGGIFVLAERDFLRTVGCLATNCVAEHENRHYVVTEGDIVVHDGNEVASIADGKVRRRIFSDMSPTFIDRAFAFVDPGSSEFTFFWPSTSSSGWCDRRATYRLHEGVWSLGVVSPNEISDAKIGSYSISGVGDTWAEPPDVIWAEDYGRWGDTGDTGVSDQVLWGLPSAVQFAEPVAGGPQGIASVVSRLAWYTKALGEPNRHKFIDRVWILGDAVGNVTLAARVGFQSSPDQPINWQAWKSLQMDSDDRLMLNVDGEGVLMSLELYSSTDNLYSINGFTVDYRMGSQW